MKNLKERKFVEQIYLDQSGITEEEKWRHIERYQFAQQYLKPNWIVLDAACGSGYGSEILSQKVRRVIGIDIDDKAINYARERHYQKNIAYQVADLNQHLNFPKEYFDAIISFETIEHLKNQEIPLSEFKRILKTGGTLIISTPDYNITSKAKIKTPYHIREFTKEEFIKLVSKFFKIESLFGQTEYIPLVWWKKLLKMFIRLDILKIRKLVFKGKIKNWARERFTNLLYTPIQKININDPSKHWVLIIVAKKL